MVKNHDFHKVLKIAVYNNIQQYTVWNNFRWIQFSMEQGCRKLNFRYNFRLNQFSMAQPDENCIGDTIFVRYTFGQDIFAVDSDQSRVMCFSFCDFKLKT